MPKAVDPNARSAACEELLGRLVDRLTPRRASLLVVRSPNASAAAALVVEVLARHGRPATILYDSRHAVPAPYESPREGGTWRVVAAPELPAAIADAARVAPVARASVSDGAASPEVASLWLPPGFREAYAELPPSAGGVLVVDDWRGLVRWYLAPARLLREWTPDRHELDRILVEEFLPRADVHLILVVPSPEPLLDDAADVVVEVSTGDAEDGTARYWIVRDAQAAPPAGPYLLRFGPGGVR